MGIAQLRDASLRRIRKILSGVSSRVLSKKDKEAIRQLKVEIMVTVSRVYHVGKAIFNIWHSALWVTANLHLEASAKKIPATSARPSHRSPTAQALSGFERISTKERVNEWLRHAEISDEPIEGYHKLLVMASEIEHDLDLIQLFNDFYRMRLEDPESEDSDSLEEVFFDGSTQYLD